MTHHEATVELLVDLARLVVQDEARNALYSARDPRLNEAMERLTRHLEVGRRVVPSTECSPQPTAQA